jgi:type IV pilus assembly protein PilQ
MRAKLAWAFLPIALVATGFGTPARAEDPSPTVISEIRPESADGATRLIVAATGQLNYTQYSPDPLTVVVDIPEVDPSKVPSRIEVGSPEVESVRVTSMARADGRTLARLEVRLARSVPYQIYSKGQSLNLVFERVPSAIGKEAPAAAAAALPIETEPAPEAEPPAPKTEPVVITAGPPAKAAKEKRAVALGNPAQRILSVASEREAGQLVVAIRADGALKYKDFFLGNPDRLVLDFSDVVSRAPQRALEVGQPPVKRVRLAQFSAASPKIARLVLDLSARTPYRVVEASDGIKVFFGEGEPPAPAPLAAPRMEAPAEPEAGMPEATLVAQAAPPALAPALPLPAPAPDPVPDPQAPSGIGAANAGEKIYTGHPISLDFKDGDLQDIFRLFADISGMNVVVNPGVSGKVTLKLNEVPWDQALDLILKANGLGYTLEGNVIRIAKLADLQKEEQDRLKLAEAKALAGDLIVYRKSLSYAKGEDLEPTIKKVALSARGTITLDKRTNTMIITDLSANVDKAKELIAELDRATPQVEIEARVVVTTRDFSRDLGIQWGFLHQRTPQFGNTTNLSFPNSIIVNGTGTGGGGLPADQGGLGPAAGIGQTGRGYLVNLPATGFNSSLGISMGNILGNFNLDVALTALERQGRGRVLSTPKVTTQNNQTAEIKQGVQIPLQTNVNNTVTVTFKDAALTLKVTPQITEAGTVILNVEIENNSPDFSRVVPGAAGVPINTQSAKTIVLVRDGATAVIGGIYQSNEQTSQSRTPFLGSLPLLGYLFRNRSVTTQNTELLLFITPRIVKS